MKVWVYFFSVVILMSCESKEIDDQKNTLNNTVQIVLERGYLLSNQVNELNYFSFSRVNDEHGLRFEYVLDSVQTRRESAVKKEEKMDLVAYTMNYFTSDDFYTLYVQEILPEPGIEKLDSLWLFDSLAILANGKPHMIYRYEIENPAMYKDVSCFFSREFGVVEQLNSWDSRLSLKNHGKSDASTLSSLVNNLRKEEAFYQSKINAPTIGE